MLAGAKKVRRGGVGVEGRLRGDVLAIGYLGFSQSIVIAFDCPEALACNVLCQI